MPVEHIERLVTYGHRKDHDTFAALLPSQKREILEAAVKKIPWQAQLETFTTSPFNRTYAVVRLYDHEEYATYLVAFGREGAFFENGHYGFKKEKDTDNAFKDAIQDMFNRAVS